MKLLVGALSLFTLIACGNGGGGDDGNPAVDAPNNPNADAYVPPGFTKLIARNWTLGAGVHDNYQCIRIKVDRDIWIGTFRALNPVGTHHQVLTISDSSTQTGEYPCSANSLDSKMLYASGVGTDDMSFPAGYAIKVKKDQYINLNLHLFNASDNMIGGESGVLVQEVAPDASTKEVGFAFGGTTTISVPHDGQDHTAVGTCTQHPAWKVFAYWPHMHQIANHQKVEINGMVVHDQAYSFMDQKFYPMINGSTAGFDIPANAPIKVTCTYNNNDTNNPGGGNVGFGDKSTDEMCFTGLYTYPAPVNLFQCASF